VILGFSEDLVIVVIANVFEAGFYEGADFQKKNKPENMPVSSFSHC
jgi:hypothetical protein